MIATIPLQLASFSQDHHFLHAVLAVITGQVFCFAEKWSHWGPEECAKPPPEEAAQLTLQVLYMLVQSFWKHQVSIKTKTPARMTGTQRQTAAQKAASLLNEQTEATTALIGTTVALAVLLPSVVKTNCFVQSHAMEINSSNHQFRSI